MRHSGLLASALALVFAACSPENAEIPVVQEIPRLVAQQEAFTRTSTNANGLGVSWAEGDALSVFNAPAGSGVWSQNLEFTLDDAAAGSFVPAAGVAVQFEDGVDYDWKAVYPYTAGLSSDELPQIPLHQIQEGKNSTAHLAVYDVMYGSVNSTDTPKILMRHTGTLMKWTVQNDSELPFNVNSISFFNGTDTYLLSVNGNTEIAPSYSADFYMVARPFDFSAGEELRISVVTSAGTEVQIRKFPSAKSFAAGQYNTATIVCNPAESPAKFHVAKDVNGAWRIYKNDEPFFIKGVAANNYYDKVAGFGGNVIRTYNLGQIDAVLAAAEATGVYVMVGLPVKRERDGFDFGNSSAIAAQLASIQSIVRSYCKRPNVLGWIIGNELDSNYSDSRVWNVVNDIAMAIKEIDPYHLTTTALAGAKKSAVSGIESMAPAIDFLCINSYYPASSNLASSLSTYEWDKPWVLSEFGPRGTWGLTATSDPPQTSWGACVELTSTQKANIYKSVLASVVAANKDKGCIGSCAFVWGYQTSGEVLTWYGMFDTDGNTFAAVDELQYAWTGSYPANCAPIITNRHSLKVDDSLIADDNIILGSGTQHTASVVASSPCGAAISCKWFIYPEGNSGANGSGAGISGLIENDSVSEISFRAPSSPGNYRLLVFVRDSANKKVASGAIPFKVADSGLGTDPDGWNAGHQNW